MKSLELPQPQLKDILQRKLTRLMTCEVEVSHRKDFPFSSGSAAFGIPFQSVRDGSLPETGKEYILGPGSGEKFLAGMSRAADEFKKFRLQVNERCGFHVHVNALDFGPFELRRLLVLFDKLHPSFYSMCTPDRMTNRYSCPEHQEEEYRIDIEALQECKSGKEIRKALLLKIYNHYPDQDIPKKRADKYSQGRYSGLNLHSWMYRGTVEFRMHHGTLSKERLTLWPQWCGWFTEFAYLLRDSEVEEISSLENLLSGAWKRPGKFLTFPKDIAGWVREEIKNPKFQSDSDFTLTPPDTEEEDEEGREPICETCDYVLSECRCCTDCECYPCQCCTTCGHHTDNCQCCEDCENYPCTCEPEVD